MNFPLLLKEHTIQGQLIKIFEPSKDSVMESYGKGLIPFPYWSQVWPAAIALAQFIISHPHYTQDKKVLELAAGLGLPSVVTASNAASVVASDYAADAILVMQQTAAYNKLQNMQVQLLDWYTLSAYLSADVLLLSDISYDATLFKIQEKAIRQFLQQGSVVIISSPQRLVAKEAILPLLSLCDYQEEITILYHGNNIPVTIMVLQMN